MSIESDPTRQAEDRFAALLPAALTAKLHAEIPLTAAMQLQVQVCEPDRVQVYAPFLPNRNLHGTAFAGALATTAIISGWLMVDTALARQGLHAEVVAQTSHADYRAPVAEGFVAESTLDALAFDKMLKLFKRMGRARIEVTTRIIQHGVEALHHQGMFAALSASRKPEHSP